MKWVLIMLITGGVLILIVVLVVVVGMMLPKGHVASVSVGLRQPPTLVWQAVSDMAAWPTWNPHVKSMTREPDRNGLPLWVQTSSDGTIPYTVEDNTAPSDGRPGRLVTRIASTDLPFGGTWTWNVAPAVDGTRVTITEDGEVYNPVFRFMARFIFGYHGTAEGYLKALGKKFGETIAPERTAAIHR